MVATDEITQSSSYSGMSEVEEFQDLRSLKSTTSTDSRNDNNNDGTSSLSENNNADVSPTKGSVENPQDLVEKPQDLKPIVVRPKITLIILLVANLINYMDRYTIAGVLLQVQEYYDITNAQLGLLQTSFIISYMLLSPLFGYLGDRSSRKACLMVGVLFWSVVTLLGSFVPAGYFGAFLFLRALVGVGEASYSTIAPTIIADMFSGDDRTKALSVFYLAIPVGSGMGYIVGAQVASLAGEWYWALRVTPGVGVLCAAAIALFLIEPPRGAADGGHDLAGTSFKEDIRYLLRHKSFITSTLGFSCVTFVTGALALWGPTYLQLSFQIKNPDKKMESVSFLFGVITCLAGLIGVVSGLVASARFRKTNQNADAIICATGVLLGGPFLFASLIFARTNEILTWFAIFMGETLLSLNWALVTDILLYTVVPTRRSSAEALQILGSHLLGDAGSPYLIGQLYDWFSAGLDESNKEGLQLSLQNSLYVTSFVCVLGSAFFFATSIFLVKDKQEVDLYIKRNLQKNNSSGAALIPATTNNSTQDIPESDGKCDPRTLLPKNEVIFVDCQQQSDDLRHNSGSDGVTYL